MVVLTGLGDEELQAGGAVIGGRRFSKLATGLAALALLTGALVASGASAPVGAVDVANLIVSPGTGLGDGDSVVISEVPELEATPSRGLLGGEVVDVTGHGYVPGPGATVRVVQCLLYSPLNPNAPQDCDETSPSTFPVQSDGTLSGHFTAKRVLTIPSGPGGQIDCAKNICSLTGTRDPDNGQTAQAVLQFGRVTVTPSTGLADHEIVQVHGEGYVPGNVVFVTQCRFGGEPPVSWFCERDPANTTDVNAGVFVLVTVKPDGTFDTPYQVKRDLPTWDFDGQTATPIVYDCLNAATPCTINAGGGGLGDATVTFAHSSATPTEPPPIAQPPATPLVRTPAFTG